MNDQQKAVYRAALIPTGTVAEVFMREIQQRCARQKQARYIGNLVWEPLHRANRYILTEVLGLEHVAAALTAYREALIGLIMNLPSTRNGRKPELFISGNLSPKALEQQLQPVTQGIHLAIGFNSDRAGQWEKDRQNAHWALAGKTWRTLSRNFEPAVSAATLNFPEPLRTAATKLPTRVGFESATQLWQRCFVATDGSSATPRTEPVRKNSDTLAEAASSSISTVAPDVSAEPVALEEPVVSAGVVSAKVVESDTAPVWTSDALPLYIQVTVLRDGMLSLSTQFNPSSQVTVRDSITKKLPAKLRKRFAQREHSILCSFRNMAATVDALVLWRREEEEAAKKLAADYETWVQGILNEDLMARLGKTFTRQELPQLMAMMEKKGLKSV
jgi:hypothetical protein